MVSGAISTILFFIFVAIICVTAINAFLVLLVRLFYDKIRHVAEVKRFQHTRMRWKIYDEEGEEIINELKNNNSNGEK